MLVLTQTAPQKQLRLLMALWLLEFPQPACCVPQFQPSKWSSLACSTPQPNTRSGVTMTREKTGPWAVSKQSQTSTQAAHQAPISEQVHLLQHYPSLEQRSQCRVKEKHTLEWNRAGLSENFRISTPATLGANHAPDRVMMDTSHSAQALAPPSPATSTTKVTVASRS